MAEYKVLYIKLRVTAVVRLPMGNHMKLKNPLCQYSIVCFDCY